MKKHERFLESLAKLLKDRKAENIVKLDFSGISFFTENFLIASAQSSTHLGSLHAEIRKFAKEKKQSIYAESMEWKSGWIVIDLGRMIVHIFSKETREMYDLENLWGDIPRTEL